jgi:hypothetical protein
LPGDPLFWPWTNPPDEKFLYGEKESPQFNNPRCPENCQARKGDVPVGRDSRGEKRMRTPKKLRNFILGNLFPLLSQIGDEGGGQQK